jgi:hypothetical protein
MIDTEYPLVLKSLGEYLILRNTASGWEASILGMENLRHTFIQILRQLLPPINLTTKK